MIIILKKIVLEKMYTHSYAGFTKYAKTVLANIKQHVKFEIATYAKNSPIQLCEQFPESINIIIMVMTIPHGKPLLPCGMVTTLNCLTV